MHGGAIGDRNIVKLRHIQGCQNNPKDNKKAGKYFIEKMF